MNFQVLFAFPRSCGLISSVTRESSHSFFAVEQLNVILILVFCPRLIHWKILDRVLSRVKENRVEIKNAEH